MLSTPGRVGSARIHDDLAEVGLSSARADGGELLCVQRDALDGRRRERLLSEGFHRLGEVFRARIGPERGR
jgi:hypothetical protein